MTVEDLLRKWMAVTWNKLIPAGMVDETRRAIRNIEARPIEEEILQALAPFADPEFEAAGTNDDDPVIPTEYKELKLGDFRRARRVYEQIVDARTRKFE